MLKKKILYTSLLLCAFSLTASASQVYLDEFQALGTNITSQVKADTEEKAQFCQKVIKDETLRLEQLLSAYIPSSDISKLGTSNGNWVEVSPDTVEILDLTKDICEITGGALDPTVGTLVKLWSVDHPNHRVPSPQEIEEALKKVDYKQIQTKKEGDKYYAKIGKGQEITLGATGKGFIADKIAQKLRANECNNVLVSLGGNIITLGTNGRGDPWFIGIQEPDLKRGRNFAAVPSKDESVVTSGDYEKFFIKDGKKYHHILNPKTGEPVPATLSSVTIINRNSGYADGLCTALFVMGWDGALKFLVEHPELKAVLIDEKLEHAAATDNLKGDLYVIEPLYQVGFIRKE